jgi:PAS domain S-box-containing protein
MNSLGQKIILLVEDEVLIAMSEAMTLEQFGYKVVTAISGEEAVSAVELTQDIDLILMDIDLGRGISGPEAAAQILNRKTLPIVFLTSHSEREMVETVRGITRYGYVIKNSGDFVLQSSIEMALELFDAHMKLTDELSARTRAEEALRESEQRYQVLADISPVGIFRTDTEGLTTYVNERWCEITGISAGEALSTGWLRAVHPDDRDTIAVNWQSAVREQAVSKSEYRFLKPDGSINWVIGQAIPEIDESNRTLGYVGTITDISERKRVEDALRESEYFFKESQRAAFTGSYKTDFTTGFWESSDILDQIFGIDQTYVRSVQGWLDIVLPEDREMMSNYLMEEVVAKHQQFNREYRIIRQSDREIRWVNGLGEVGFDSKGNVISLIGTIQDITERKRAEKLQDAIYRIPEVAGRAESMDTFYSGIHAIIQEVMVADNFYIALYDGTNDVLSFPYSVDEADGPAPPQKPGKGLTEYVLRNAKSLLCNEALFAELQQRGEIELVGINSLIWLGVPLIIAGKAIGIMAVQDYNNARAYGEREQRILEFVSSQVAMAIHRKQAEQALIESEERFRSMSNASLEAIMIHDNGVILDANLAFAQLFGYEHPEELIGKNGEDFMLAPESRTRIHEQRQQQKPGAIILTGVRKDGTTFEAETESQPVKHLGHDARIVSCRDITNRKRAEEALRESEEIFMRFMEHSPIYVFFKDENIRALRLSRNYETMLGKPVSELLGKNMDDLFPSDLAKNMVADDQRILEEGSAITVEEELNGRFYTTIKFPISIEGKPRYLAGYTIDITERKRMEDELRRRNRMLQMLSETNQQLIHATDETELLKTVCQLAVEEGGYRMAWVGLAEQDTAKSVRPVAQAGFVSGYLESVNITWADAERGRGPTGIAIRTGKVALARNIPGDPNYGPWREEAIKRDYMSSIALPLMAEGKAWGALCIYAAEPDAFDEEEIALLTEMAGDLTYGTGTLRSRAERDRAEKALRESEYFFKESQRAAFIGSYKTDFITGHWESSEILDQIFGIDDKYDKSIQGWLAIVHPDDREMMERYLREEVIVKRNPFSREYRIIRQSDGETRLVKGLGEVSFDSEGNILSMIGSIQDVTEQKQTEFKLREALTVAQRFREALDHVPAFIYMKDAQSRYIYANRPTLELFGRSTEDVVGCDDTKFFPPDTASRLQEVDARVFCGEQTVEEIDVPDAEGGRRVYWEVKTPIYAEPGSRTISGLLGISTDITAHTRVEEAIQASEARLEEAQRIAHIGNWERNIVTNELHWSNEIYRIFGLQVQEFEATYEAFMDFVHPDDREFLQKSVQEAADDDKPYGIDHRIVRPDGEVRFVHEQGEVVFDDSGAPVRVIGTVQDITARKRTEEALQESERRFRETLENVNMIAVGLDAKGCITFCNDYFLRLTGWQRDEVMGKEWFSTFLPEEVCEQVRQMFAAGISSGDLPAHYDNAILTHDGEERLISWNNSMLRDPRRIVNGTVSIGEDITERKRVEKALRESEAKYRELVADISDGIFITDDRGVLTFVNTALARIHGFEDPDQLIGRTFIDFIAPPMANEVAGYFRQVVKSGQPQAPITVKLVRPDGTQAVVEVKADVKRDEGKIVGTHGVLRDISEREQTEEALHASQQITQGIINAIPARVFWKDRNLVYLGCNEAFARDAGFSDPKDIIGKDDYQMGWREQAELYRSDDSQVIESSRSRILIEEPQTTPEGNTITLLTSKIPLRSTTGEISGVLGTYIDITERKRMEEALRFRNLILTTQQESSIDGILVVDDRGAIVSSNNRFAEMWDISPEIIQSNSQERALQAVKDKLADPVEFVSKVNQLYAAPVETSRDEIALKDGRIFDRYSAPMLDANHKYLGRVWYFRDITERRRAEEKVKALLMEKELILKEVHHRIKNNMNTLNGLLALQAGQTTEPAVVEALDDARSRVQSMMVLYDRLYQSVNVNEMSVQEYLPTLIDQIIGNFPGSESVTVEKHIDDFVLEAKSLSSLGIILNELFTNIMKYAFIGRDDGVITVSASLNNKTVSLVIQDNGAGMPESVDFEHSTGFGLTLVWLLIKQLGGTVRTERENGTRIILEFRKD